MRRCAQRPDDATSCAQPACVRAQVPLLYWLGGVTLLFSWYVQNLALVKIYRRPKALDHHVAERSRHFLCLLLGLHVCTSTAFYTRQAYVTGSHWDTEAMEPFTLSFLACLAYLLFELASGDMMREAVRLRDGPGGLHAPPHLAACPCGALPYLPGQTCSPTPLTSPPPLLRCASAAARPIARAAPTASSRRCSTRPLPSTRRRTSRSTAAPRRACRPPPRSRCGPASAESSSGAMSYDLATSPASAARAPPRRPQTPLPAGARAPLNGPAAGARAAWRARRATALRRKRRGQ